MLSIRKYDYADLFKAVRCNNIGEVIDIIVYVGVYSSSENPLKVEKFKAVDFVNGDGETALHIADHHGHLTMVQLLVDKGAFVNQQDLSGDTPLIAAIKASCGASTGDIVSTGLADVIAFLKKNGADINSVRRSNRLLALITSTALSRASEFGDVKIMERLIEEGADVNQPIWYSENYVDILKITLSPPKFDAALLLIRHGAKITKYNIKKFMAVIVRHNRVDLLQAAIEAGLSVSQPFRILLSNGLHEEQALLVLAIVASFHWANRHPDEKTLRVDAINVLVDAGGIFSISNGEALGRAGARLFLAELTTDEKPEESKRLVLSAAVKESVYQRRRAALLLWVENHPMPDSAPIVAP